MASIEMNKDQYEEMRENLGKSELVSLHKEIDDNNGIVETSSVHIKYVFDEANKALRLSFRSLRGDFVHDGESIKQHLQDLVKGIEKPDPNVQPKVTVPTPSPQNLEPEGNHGGFTDTTELVPQPEEKEKYEQNMQEHRDESNK